MEEDTLGMTKRAENDGGATFGVQLYIAQRPAAAASVAPDETGRLGFITYSSESPVPRHRQFLGI